MFDAFTIFAQPEAWAALVTLIVMEVVLGIDNLIFISILSNKLPEAQRQRARRIGISLALVMRLALLSIIAWLVGLTATVFDLGIQGAVGAHGEPGFETAFSWRDLILIAGGLFLIWKATSEIRHNVDPSEADDLFGPTAPDDPFERLALVDDAFDSVESGDVVLVSHQLPIWVAHLSVAGESFPHDPRKRRCALSSITTFERTTEPAPAPQPRPGEDPLPADPSTPPVVRLVEVGYAEPAGSLIATATDVGAV